MSRNYSSIVEPKALTADANSSATQITLNNVTGLPSPPYVLVLNPDTANEEAVLVTVDQAGVTSPTLKIQRAIETGATAKSHTTGHIVKHMIVGSDLQIVHDHFSNESTTAGTAHGATGGVVGRTNSQTLTNKTINLTDNTLTGTKAQFNAALSDADFATIAGTETLTNKTLTSPVITGGTVNGGAALTVDSTELNTLDGITSSAAELNILDGATLTTTELNYVDGVTSAIQTQLTTNTPVGVVNMWVTDSAPTGWLICDGTEKLVSAYPTLADVLSTTYGARTNGSGGAGTTHFRLPDLRGRVPMGAGTGRNVAGDANLPSARTLGAKVSDAETVTLTAAQSGLRQHNHTASQASHSHGIGYTSSGNNYYAFGQITDITRGGTDYIENRAFTSDTQQPAVTVNDRAAVDATESHTNTQPSTVINFIIKH